MPFSGQWTLRSRNILKYYQERNIWLTLLDYSYKSFLSSICQISGPLEPNYFSWLFILVGCCQAHYSRERRSNKDDKCCCWSWWSRSWVSTISSLACRLVERVRYKSGCVSSVSWPGKLIYYTTFMQITTNIYRVWSWLSSNIKFTLRILYTYHWSVRDQSRYQQTDLDRCNPILIFVCSHLPLEYNPLILSQKIDTTVVTSSLPQRTFEVH